MVKKILTVQGIKISVYYEGEEEELSTNSKPKLPVVIYNSYNRDGQEVWDECMKLKCPEFALVVVEVSNWNNDMTPWPSDPIFSKTEGYSGKADDYLKVLEQEILPTVETLLQPKDYILSGYSLAGLFSIYAMFKTTRFTKFLSGSGSFWYPGFKEFYEKTTLPSPLPTKVYLSLGAREKKTKNVIMKTIETETIAVKEFLIQQNIPLKFELNPGGHFNDVNQRIAQGIKWLLE